MGYPVIIGAMRVKNEARWIEEVIASMFPLCSHVFVFNDHSSDSTVGICMRINGVTVVESPFAGLDEVRDKQFLLNQVRAICKPDYLAFLDGDEVLEAGAADKIRARLDPRYALYCFPIKYLWNDRQHYRADGVYGRYKQWRMFSLIDQPADLRFESKEKGGFHCGNAPKGLRGGGAMVSCDVLHLGYMDAEDRLRKFAWYNRIDPGNTAEGGYKHVVIGDLFPADSQFLHGGPLKLLPLAASKWPASIEAARV